MENSFAVHDTRVSYLIVLHQNRCFHRAVASGVLPAHFMFGPRSLHTSNIVQYFKNVIPLLRNPGDGPEFSCIKIAYVLLRTWHNGIFQIGPIPFAEVGLYVQMNVSFFNQNITKMRQPITASSPSCASFQGEYCQSHHHGGLSPQAKLQAPQIETFF